MSDLNPRGVKVELNDSTYYFLFTLNVIDEIQSEFDMNCINTFNSMFHSETEGENARNIRKIVKILVNDYIERTKDKDKDFPMKVLSEKQAGWLVDRFNMDEVFKAIIDAYGLSMPAKDDDEDSEESPNLKSE